GDDQRAAQVAKKYPLNQKNQGNAKQHIVQHRTHGDRDQIAAIVERLDFHAGWQAAVVIDAFDRRPDARDHVHSALELLHQDDAEDDVVLAVAAGNSESRREADLIVSDVGQHDRQSALLANDDIVDVADRAKHAHTAHIDRLFTHRDGASADVGVAGRDCIDDLRQRHAVGTHPVEVDFGLVFLGLAAEPCDVRHARNDAEFAFDYPILKRFKLDQVHARWTFELVAQNLADAASRRDHW